MTMVVSMWRGAMTMVVSMWRGATMTMRRSLTVDIMEDTVHMVMVTITIIMEVEDALHMIMNMVMALLLLVARVKGHFIPYGAFIHVTDSYSILTQLSTLFAPGLFLTAHTTNPELA
ncbi:hypothetical protein, partial [Acinetobacter baumannii]|uniref:hypothetical protein n=1 Tax=Acinetobacter baumannii TaxID=470 RepID=UPI0011137A9A